MNIEANGITMRYTLEGPAGAPVVTLSHSLATHAGMWDATAPALASFRVLRYDTRGHGGTEAPAGPYSLDVLAADALALLEALGIQRTHWVGLSMGGMIGQTIALKRRGALLSLALCDTTSRVPPEARGTWAERIATAEAQGMEPLVEPTIARWFTPDFIRTRPEVVDRVRAMIRETPARGYAGCCHAIAQLDLTDRLGEIGIPTLVVVGEEDQGTPVSAARTIHEHVKGSQLIVLKSASHLSNIEQPEPFNQAVKHFLATAP
jgi:3-oxoadipate enol-lactonase